MDPTWIAGIERIVALGGTGWLIITIYLLISGRVHPDYVVKRLEKSLQEMAEDRNFYRDKFLALSEEVRDTIQETQPKRGGR